jgi:myo-inositol catabolism protein IolC
MADLQAAGIEPDIWKVEGLETADAANRTVAAARAGGRGAARCIILGRDAPANRLDHWLNMAAGTEGFVGFAIGRSIWEAPLADHIAGRSTASQLVDRVAASYAHYVTTYLAAKKKPGH